MTCSINTWTALTSRDDVNADEIPPESLHTGDDDSGVEPSGADVVGFFLETGIAPSFLKNDRSGLKGIVYACSII
jgi:hypothetical protein